MQLSLITVILSLTVGTLAQVGISKIECFSLTLALQDPVYMDKRGWGHCIMGIDAYRKYRPCESWKEV